MPTKAERTALIFLATVVLVGGLVRVGRAVRGGMRPPPAAVTALAAQRRVVDSAGRAGGTPRGGRGTPKTAGGQPGRGRSVRQPSSPAGKPLTPSFPIDVDRATAAELDALPRIGPALAARIVAEREANGPFGGLDALDKRVKGIGPALTKAMQPFVSFSGR